MSGTEATSAIRAEGDYRAMAAAPMAAKSFGSVLRK
jgi:hypothetical protein